MTTRATRTTRLCPLPPTVSCNVPHHPSHLVDQHAAKPGATSRDPLRNPCILQRHDPSGHRCQVFPGAAVCRARMNQGPISRRSSDRVLLSPTARASTRHFRKRQRRPHHPSARQPLESSANHSSVCRFASPHISPSHPLHQAKKRQKLSKMSATADCEATPPSAGARGRQPSA